MTAAGGTEWLRQQRARQMAGGREQPLATTEALALLVESWLIERGVTYAPPSQVPMTLIDVKRSRANQARATPLVPESVERFVLALRAGRPLPPIVVYPSGNKLVIVDGINRHEAHRRQDRKEIFGIVIDESTPGEKIRLLTVEANANHGATPDVSWRVRQAEGLVALGFNDQQAAAAAAVSLAQLRTARAAEAAAARAKVLHIPNFSELPPTVRQSLGQLRDDQVFVQASRFAVASGLTLDRTRALMKELKDLPGEAQRLARLAEVSDEHVVEKATREALGRSSRTVTSAKLRLVTGIGQVAGVNVNDLVRSVVTERDRALLLERLDQIAAKWNEITDALNKITFEEDD